MLILYYTFVAERKQLTGVMLLDQEMNTSQPHDVKHTS